MTETAPDVAELRSLYENWSAERVRLSELEESGNFPPSDEWHYNDDEAVDLLQAIAPAFLTIAEAVEGLAMIDGTDWPRHLTCTEIELIAGVLRAAGHDDSADALIASHAEADNENDDHYYRRAK